MKLKAVSYTHLEHVKDMDVIFCSALVPGKIAPVVITEEMVKSMKPGSVIVDIAIDQMCIRDSP